MQYNLDRDVTHVGRFKVHDKEYDGQLRYNTKLGVAVVDISMQQNGLGEKFGDEPCIVGKLTYGAIVTLFNCKCVSNQVQAFSSQTVCLRAEYFIISNKSAEDRRFHSLQFELENALRWSGLTKIECKGINQVTFDWDKPICKKLELDGYAVEFKTSLQNGFSSRPLKEEVRVTERLYVSILFEEVTDIKELIKRRDEIISLITYAIKDNINIVSQLLIDNKDMDVYIPVQHELYTGESYKDIVFGSRFDCNFTLPQLVDGFTAERMNNLSKMLPIFNLYLSLFKYRDMPTEMVFLNIVQALETLHARFYCNCKKTFLESIEKRFGPIDDSKHKGVKELLWDKEWDLGKNNHLVLASRLNDLLVGNGNGGFGKYYTQSGYVQQIVDTRNYYTHYDERKREKAFSGDDLLEAIYVMRVLLEYHIGLILDIDIDIEKETRNKLSRLNLK